MRPSTPTSTLFPYTTLFRSETRSKRLVRERDREQDQRASRAQPRLDLEERAGEAAGGRPLEHGERRRGCDPRSEERRVGKEGRCRRWREAGREKGNERREVA